MTQTPTPSMVYDLIEACDRPGCPLCRLSNRWGERFVAAILYEEVTDPNTRGRLKDSLGFCRDHAWQASQVGGTLLGISIIYRGLLAQLDRELAKPVAPTKHNWWQTFGTGKSVGPAVPSNLTAKTSCPACVHLQDMEDAALIALAETIPHNPRVRASLERPAVLFCLPHMRRALAVAPTPEASAFLRESTRLKLAGIVAELDEFIRKYDHRFNREEWGAERDSWERAIAWLVGGVLD